MGTEQGKRLTIPQEMNKEAEIMLINRFYALLPEDSYLKLILKGAAEHIEQQIRDDHAIALVESIQYYSLQSEGNLALALNNAKELERLRGELELVQDNFDALQEENGDLRDELSNYRENAAKVIEEATLNVKNDLVKAKGELIGYKQTVAKDEVFIGQLLGELHNLRLEKGVVEQERDEFREMYESLNLQVKGALT
jgi:hypothetical protein